MSVVTAHDRCMIYGHRFRDGVCIYCDEKEKVLTKLRKCRVYSVSDGDGHFDQMDEYSERGEYYYAADVDAEIERLQRELCDARELIANAIGDAPEPKPDLAGLYLCDKCRTPMRCGPKQWEYQCQCHEPSSDAGRPVRPHRSGGGPGYFSDERLQRIDNLMNAERGTPEGAELNKLVDEQVKSENALDMLMADPVGRCNACGRKTWDRSQIGKRDEMTQPNFKQCFGTFEPYP